MSQPKYGAGDVMLDLAGEKVTLRPTLNAALKISSMTGGIMAAVNACARFDANIIVSVVALGLDKKEDEVAQKVFDAGFGDVAPSVIDYLTRLNNGGRAVEKDDKKPGGEGGKNPPA